MSTISASTTSTTAYVVTADTTGTLVLQTGATPTTAVTIDASQNVGIGTSSTPATANYKTLAISGTTGAEIFLQTGSTNYGYIYADNGGFRLIAPASGAATGTMQFSTSNTERMRIDSSGNVGIGTTAPLTKLEVRGTPDINWGNALLFDNRSVAINQGGVLTFGGYKTTTTSQATFAYIQGAKENSTSGNEAGYLAFSTNNNSAYAERMRITSGGNVGIGTTNPSQLLQLEASGNPCILLKDTTNNVQAYMFAGDTASYVGSANNYPVVFQVNDTEKMRIDTSGNLLVGTTSSDTSAVGARLLASNQIQASKSGDWSFRMGRRDSGGIITEIYYNSSRVGDIATNGSNTTYNSASDYRLKQDIAPMTSALAKVAALKPVTYKWKVDGSDGQGFIAHELAKIVPDAVRGEKDEVDANGKPVYQSIDTSVLVATLTAAIQELKAINDTQAETINALTARIVALESRGTV
jgi:hypothetical protein